VTYFGHPDTISGYDTYALMTRSFFQGLCALGYCIAPLDIAALISCFVRVIWVRAPVALAAWAWCIWGILGLLQPIQSLTLNSGSSIRKLLGRHEN